MTETAGTMVERAIKAIHIALLKQEDGGVYASQHVSRGRVQVDGHVNIGDVARAVIAAMSEPTEAMIERAARQLLIEGYSDCSEEEMNEEVWPEVWPQAAEGYRNKARRVIQAALSEDRQ